jgi:hypothetical protein
MGELHARRGQDVVAANARASSVGGAEVAAEEPHQARRMPCENGR